MFSQQLTRTFLFFINVFFKRVNGLNAFNAIHDTCEWLLELRLNSFVLNPLEFRTLRILQEKKS